MNQMFVENLLLVKKGFIICESIIHSNSKESELVKKLIQGKIKKPQVRYTSDWRFKRAFYQDVDSTLNNLYHFVNNYKDEIEVFLYWCKQISVDIEKILDNENISYTSIIIDKSYSFLEGLNMITIGLQELHLLTKKNNSLKRKLLFVNTKKTIFPCKIYSLNSNIKEFKKTIAKDLEYFITK